MKIVIFGGSGRVGTAARRMWSAHEIRSPGREVNVEDADSVAAYLREHQPEVVVNLIAYNNVDAAEGVGRDENERLNSNVPGVLAQAVRQQGARFIHLSTDYVFDGDAAHDETAVPNPSSAYAKAKYAGELCVQAEHPEAIIVRTSRLYGLKGDSTNAKASFVELIVADAAKAARILVNADERSAPTYVDDLVAQIGEHLLVSSAAPGIYHIVNDGGATWHEWAQEIGRRMELPVTFAPRDSASLKRAAPRPAASLLTTSKLPKLRSWKEALREYLAANAPAFAPQWTSLGIEGASIEPQPRLGDAMGAVMHMLPGGTRNAAGFGDALQDIYATSAKGRGVFRGGHYHHVLNELFLPMAGVGLWVLSDFRTTSPTFGKTIGFVMGIDDVVDAPQLPHFTLEKDGTLPRLRVPAGVYHTYVPLTDERTTFVGIGDTPYIKDDYAYPTHAEVPGLIELLRASGIETA